MGISNPGGGSLWTLLHDEELAAPGRFDVSSISQAHSQLQLYIWLRGDVAAVNDFINIYFNGDTTDTNYRRGHHIGGSSHVVGTADDSRIVLAPAATATADYFISGSILIQSYTLATNFKIANCFAGYREDAATIQTELHTVFWESQAAIDQITIQPDGFAGDEFVAESKLQIYGIGTA